MKTSSPSSQEPTVFKMQDIWNRLLQIVCLFGVVSTLAGVGILSAQVSKVRQEQARVSAELSRLEDEVVAALGANVAAVQAEQAGDILDLRTNLSGMHT
ncbi:Hypp5916 [Branchiostoma lanceolatum]|uniref:Hypp5916 protein n=1 Tax=Branchiostoma lanceolatum TaxID=7740 RepID=A0A8J9YSL0_BRALA|nr:Hypp5916 [Branchiostoma lanceolatum]